MSNNPDLENRFTYHVPSGDQPERYKRLRDQAKDLGYLIDDLVPDGREKSLALGKLEECVMWANAGVARIPRK